MRSPYPEVNNQLIIAKANGIVYNRSSMCFHYNLETGMYCETFSGMQLTPFEIEEVCKVIEASNLRRLKIVKFRSEDCEPYPCTILI